MRRFGNEFRFTLITNDPVLAKRADAADINLIGVDIERANKSARQSHIPNARISDHKLADLDLLAPVVRQAMLFARVNPLHADSKREVEDALAHKTVTLMLPFFKTAKEVDEFVRLVDGRARIILLLETAAAVVRLRDILAVSGFDEVMVGLNDLHLSTGVSNHFELVTSDLMTMISDAVRSSGRRFGFGGLARTGDNNLPIPSDLVIAQHARLGSTSSWISRSFLGQNPLSIDLGLEITRLRERLSFWATQLPSELHQQRERLRLHLQSMATSNGETPGIAKT